MPISDGTTIGVPRPLAERIREISEREDRPIVTVVERMVDLYEPLTLLAWARLNKIADELKLTTGQALEYCIDQCIYHKNGGTQQ